jgi:hypothetical protein
MTLANIMPCITLQKLRSPYDLAVNHGLYKLLDLLSGEISVEEYSERSAEYTKIQESVCFNVLWNEASHYLHILLDRKS